MFRRLGQKLYNFMLGRNGPDNLFRFCVWASFAVAVIAIFVRNFWASSALSLIYYGLLGYAVFRVLSKNVYKRRAENAKYLGVRNKLLSFFRRKRSQFKERKTHVYKKCPHCKATLRLPRKKGKHTVSCPRCRKTFETKI